MATIKKALTLKHQSNLGDEIEEVTFEAGEDVTLLKQWDDSVLCKNVDGQLFNIPKDAVEI